ncbi:hypothetical protein R1T08_28435 [Streptomyces sp. SBC-4]|nr:hypothetical protein [Streptomyces sp. SBC-4]MDV5147994.1 hypothetical protein [Streptomyces sp. SBC-4]
MTEPTEAGRTTESGPPVAYAGAGPLVDGLLDPPIGIPLGTTL